MKVKFRQFGLVDKLSEDVAIDSRSGLGLNFSMTKPDGEPDELSVELARARKPKATFQ
jgi:hypothetical protein